MYFYVEIGNNEDVKGIINLSERPSPSDIKNVDGRPALRPLVDEEPPNPEAAELYMITGSTMVVESTRVVRKYKTVLKENYKDILKNRVISEAHTARGRVLTSPELEGSGLILKMMMNDEAKELLLTAEADRIKERFPLVFAGVGSIGSSVEEVANKYREDFSFIKAKIALIEGEKLRTLRMIDSAQTPDSAMRFFDSRSSVLRSF